MTDNKSQNLKNSTPKARTRSLTTCQSCLLIFLLGVILAILAGGLGFVTYQEGYWRVSTETFLPNQPEATQIDPNLAVYQLPPTWTSTAAANNLTPTLPATPGDMEQRPAFPTATTTRTPPPVVSLTPPFDHWQIILGYSVKNRPIEVFRFGIGKKERMIVAGVHGGNESNTIALADEMIEHLILHPEIIPADTTLYILRSLNPDGEAVGQKAEGRANANGVDLNRNFEVNWKSHWKTKGCWADLPMSAGSAPGSEPETQALMKFILSRHVDALVSYHSAGLGIFPSGDPPDPASIRLAEAISQASGYRYPPVATGCEYSGSLVDWAQQHSITAVDVELPDHITTDLAKNLKVLAVLLNW